MNKKQELIIKDLTVGKGPAVKDGDRVLMHYTGWLEEPIGSGKTGKKFDSSYDRDEAFETPIGVGYVIKGWDLGVVGMKVGGKRRLIIPSDLGYGKYGAGADIPGFASLIFDVELVAIK